MGGVIQIEGFQARLAGDALGHAEQDELRHGQLLQYLARHVELALATVDEQDVRQLALALRRLAKTPRQCLMHCRIVVSGGDALDVVAAIVGFQRAFRAEHHTGGDGSLAAGVADVEAFQAHRWLVELQRFGQCVEACRQMLTIGQARAQRLFGVGQRQLLPACPRRAYPMGDGQLDATQLGDGIDQRGEILVYRIDDQLAGQVAFRSPQVVLLQKGLQHLADAFLNGNLRKEVLAAQHSPTTHGDQMHASAAWADRRGDDVDIARTPFHALLVLHAAQDADLVTDLGGALEIQIRRRLFHVARQLLRQCIAATLKEHHRVTHIFGVLFGVDQLHAWRLAALDLVLQAGPGAVAEIAVLALPHEEGLLQQAQAFADRAGARIGAEVASGLLLGATMNTQSWKFTGREEHIGIGLIVP